MLAGFHRMLYRRCLVPSRPDAQVALPRRHPPSPLLVAGRGIWSSWTIEWDTKVTGAYQTTSSCPDERAPLVRFEQLHLTRTHRLLGPRAVFPVGEARTAHSRLQCGPPDESGQTTARATPPAQLACRPPPSPPRRPCTFDERRAATACTASLIPGAQSFPDGRAFGSN